MANKKTKNLAARLARGSAPNRGKHGRQHRVDQHPRRGRGRPPGAKNYFTREVKEALIAAVNEYGSDGRGKNGMKGFFLKMCDEEPTSVMSILRATMPTQVSVERKDVPVKTEQEVRARLERIGLRLEDLRQYRFHTPAQVLELTAEDVSENEGTNGADGGS